MSHDLPSCLSELKKKKKKLFLSITEVLKFHSIALLELIIFRASESCLWTFRLKMQVLQTQEESFHLSGNVVLPASLILLLELLPS